MNDDNDPHVLRRAVAANVQREMKRLPEIRKQTQLAKKAGVSQSSISRVLNAKSGVTLEVLASVAQACGVMAYKLLLSPPDDPSPPENSTEGQRLMRRLANAPKQEVSREQGSGSQATKPRAAGVHRHSSKPGLRKKPHSTEND